MAYEASISINGMQAVNLTKWRQSMRRTLCTLLAGMVLFCGGCASRVIETEKPPEKKEAPIVTPEAVAVAPPVTVNPQPVVVKPEPLPSVELYRMYLDALGTQRSVLVDALKSPNVSAATVALAATPAAPEKSVPMLPNLHTVIFRSYAEKNREERVQQVSVSEDSAEKAGSEAEKKVE